MNDKVKMGLLLTLLLCACLVLQYFFNYAIDFVILLLSFVALKEMKKMQLKSGNPTFKYVGEVGCFAVFICAFVGVMCGLNATAILGLTFGVVALIYVATLLGSMFLMGKDLQGDTFRCSTNMTVKEFALFKATNTLAVMIYPTILMFFMYLLNHFNQLGLEKFNETTSGVPMGLFSLVLLFAIVCLTDTFAMCFGKLIKGKKLCPRISPQKTVSGALMGLLGGVIGALATYFVFFFIFRDVFSAVAFWKFIIIGFLGSVIAQAGDFLESVLKRKAGLKDSGDFFRSHGGMLDRFDSVLFNIPFIFVCVILIFG